MTEIVNLNRFRKERARAARRAEGDANAAKFGRTKAERDLDTARAEKSARDHAGHARDAHARDADDAGHTRENDDEDDGA